LGVGAGEEGAEDAEVDEEAWPGETLVLAFLETAAATERRVTVRSVLKYSLSCVITPSGPTVQACTQ
jgi:hypothetical protein